jgi:hypothetical protein
MLGFRASIYTRATSIYTGATSMLGSRASIYTRAVQVLSWSIGRLGDRTPRWGEGWSLGRKELAEPHGFLFAGSGSWRWRRLCAFGA